MDYISNIPIEPFPDIKNVNPYDEIVPNLHLGGIKSLDNYNYKYRKNTLYFHMIVNLIKQVHLSDDTIPQCDIYVTLPIHDSSDECEKLLTLINETNVLERMHDEIIKNNPVLVHCFAGMQRSCALVACYLIKYYNMKPNDAIDFIKQKRPIAFFGQVNFMDMILEFYKQQLLGKAAPKAAF